MKKDKQKKSAIANARFDTRLSEEQKSLFEEAAKIMQAKAQQGPSAEQQEIQSKTELNKAKTQESGSITALNLKKAEDIDTDNMFEALAAKRGKLSAVEID